MEEQPVITGCDTPLGALGRCAVCLPATGDTTCDTCSKSDCCAEVGDYALAPDGQMLLSCVTACTTDACVDACLQSYPVAGAAIEELFDCQTASCAEPCMCEAATDDTTCDTCNKTSCCSEWVDYSLTPDVEGFVECASVCADQPCVDACVAQFPSAGAAYGTWSDCLYTSCYDECS
jgi:hypothetical protein